VSAVVVQHISYLLLVTLFDENPVFMGGDFPEGNPSRYSVVVMEYVSSSLVRIPAFISDSSFFFVSVSITILFFLVSAYTTASKTAER
jgi:hypothetical protein